MGSPPADRSFFLRRVRIRNYKSLGNADVELGRLTVLIGRNGSGKSNFLDALYFVADALRTSLDHALKSRGGIESVRRRSSGQAQSFAIVLDVLLPGSQIAEYGLEVAARQRGGFSIRRESLRIESEGGAVVGSYEIRSGTLVSASADNMPRVFRTVSTLSRPPASHSSEGFTISSSQWGSTI
ncbi:MAG TPA: AAA family ATPase [Thermoanaerobaculia bacterium]|jgi:predicted ATPase|nr:AAA family ATPase [Thermoanaerobaculia bacterium]